MTSIRDKMVLESIFNPFLSDLSWKEEELRRENEETTVVEISDDFKRAEEIERTAIQLAENGEIKRSILQFNNAIEIAPTKASCYNNRAQALHLDGDLQGALDDLSRALDISEGKGEIAGKAFCQRAVINRFLGHEEDSLIDFKNASELGNSFAKSHLAKLNPYAALCNQMLTEMMGKLGKREDKQMIADEKN